MTNERSNAVEHLLGIANGDKEKHEADKRAVEYLANLDTGGATKKQEKEIEDAVNSNPLLQIARKMGEV